VNQPSLFGDNADKQAENAGEEINISSIFEFRELAREYFPLPPKPPPSRSRSRPISQKERALAARRGLAAKWSREFGYISVHDPGSGEWHDMPIKEAPGWARWEARKRKELYKAGDRHAYELTRKHMEQIWDEEHSSESEEGIVEDHALPE
jgi:hypothetical protein